MKEPKTKYMQNNRAFCKIDSESDRADSGNIFEGNIARFTEKIRKGPVFICVVCNHCLYDRSVMIFNENSYVIGDPYFSYSFVHSFDGKLYICLTCHRKLKRHIIPDISVFNKLSLSEFPEDFPQLNRLEKFIIAKRMLFKKIVIMPKGQSPKMNPDPFVISQLNAKIYVMFYHVAWITMGLC